MPWGRYPGRVKDFRKWSSSKIDASELSDSATPHRMRTSRKFRRKRRSRRKNAKKET